MFFWTLFYDVRKSAVVFCTVISVHGFAMIRMLAGVMLTANDLYF